MKQDWLTCTFVIYFYVSNSPYWCWYEPYDNDDDGGDGDGDGGVGDEDENNEQ